MTHSTVLLNSLAASDGFVHFDNSLTWKVHGNICVLIYSRFFIVYADCVYVDQRIMFLFYQDVPLSLVRYGMSAWYVNLGVVWQN